MKTELVRTTTTDGLRLDGAYFLSDQPALLSLDAVVLLHGVGGNFYGGAMFDHMVSHLNSLGVHALRINTRGRDSVFAAQTPAGRRRFGAAFEIIDECRFDIAAWLDFLTSRGAARVGLLGHSLGAIKALYSQAIQKDERVECVIAMSPPCLSYRRFMESAERQTFQQSMDEAERLREAQQGEQLFRATFPFPLLISGDTYVDKYGPAERYNILSFLNRVTCRSLMLYGERELTAGGVAFAGLAEAIDDLRQFDSSLEFSEIAEADHFYTGVHLEAAKTVGLWLRERFAA